MDLQVGSVVTGKVTGIAKFGAFVEVAPGKSGLVHISEIADTFVREVSEHLDVGQQVLVKIIGVEGGRMNLSIKAAAQNAENQPRAGRDAQPVSAQTGGQENAPVLHEPSPDDAFEDRLKKFMKDSNSKISDMRRSERQSGTRRRGK